MDEQQQLVQYEGTIQFTDESTISSVDESLRKSTGVVSTSEASMLPMDASDGVEAMTIFKHRFEER